MSGFDAEAVRQDLREIAQARGLLVSGLGPDDYAWYHSLVRDVVLGSDSLGTQTRWREGLSGVLTGQGLALRAARHALEALHGQARSALVPCSSAWRTRSLSSRSRPARICAGRALALAGEQLDVESPSRCSVGWVFAWPLPGTVRGCRGRVDPGSGARATRSSSGPACSSRARH